ncbi:MAG: glycosyltransferase family 4 protein [Opitutales bacterium]
MNIWLFNPFDLLPWEGKPQRYATLASCLAEQGHAVVHWSSGFSHSFKKRRVIPEDFDLAALPYAIELVDCPAYTSNVSLRRLINHAQYGKGLVREGRRAVASGRHTPPDLILASMPPMEGPAAALKLKQHFGCKVVLDVMDAWPETLRQAMPGAGSGEQGAGSGVTAVLRPLSSAILWPYYRMLRRACRESDAVCAQSKAFADFAREHGAKGEIPVFYLGAEPPHRCRAAERRSCGPPLLSEQEGSGVRVGEELPVEERATDTPQPPLRLLYLGAMGRSYDLGTLFDAVEQLNRQGPKVSLAMVGEGEKRSALEARQLAHVQFTGFMSGESLVAQLQHADVGIVPFLPGSGVAMPYKAGEYLAYGLPVISSIDGELGALLKAYTCGMTYTAGRADSLVTAIQAYLHDSAKLAREKEAALSCYYATFNREKIYPDFAQWIESLPSLRGDDSFSRF